MTETTENDASHGQGVERDVRIAENSWRDLLKFGGSAGILAGVLFRRNFAAELSLFGNIMPPSDALGWFTSLQENGILGVILLDILDVINYILVGLLFLALYIPLRYRSRGHMVVAIAIAFIGIAISISSNVAFSMLSLSERYFAATTDSQRTLLLAAGEAVLATTNSTGYYVGFVLLAIASLFVSVTMLHSKAFSRPTAMAGILASVCDFLYCITVQLGMEIGVLFVSAAGLLLMIWHITGGYQLVRLIQAGRRGG